MEPQQPQSGGPAGGWQTPVEPAGPAPGIRFAGHGARLVAYLVDGFLLAIGYMVVFGVVALAGLGAYLDRDGELGAAAVGGFILLVLFGIVVSIAYFPFFWARSGQTPRDAAVPPARRPRSGRRADLRDPGRHAARGLPGSTAWRCTSGSPGSSSTSAGAGGTT